jgi:hypothetical protein
MIRRSNDFRLALLALVATMGVVSFSGDGRAETASSGTATRAAGRSCCVNRVCPAGCCVRGGSPGRTRANEPAVAGLSRTNGSTNSAPSCECRPGEPASPAAKAGSQSFQIRQGAGAGESVSLTFSIADLGLLSRLTEAVRRPPKSPLYLMIARLII